MNKKLIVLLFFFILSHLSNMLPAQENGKTNIAVIDLSSRGGLSTSEIGTLTDRLRSLLVRTNAFNVVDRGKMEEILAEQGKIEVKCEFCYTGYSFQRADLEPYFMEQDINEMAQNLSSSRTLH